MKNVMKVVAISTIAAAAGMASAAGTYTTIGNTPSNEVHVTRIMRAIATGNAGLATGNTALPSSGVFNSVAGSISYNLGGGLTAVRIFDQVSGGVGDVLKLHEGFNANSSDQVWRDGQLQFESRARYSAQNQFFGLQKNAGVAASDTGFTDVISPFDTNNNDDALLNIGSPNFQFLSGASAPTVTVNIGSPVDFRWMRSASQQGSTNDGFSRQSDNTGANLRDRMIAFQIIDSNNLNKKQYVLAFEDGSDNDYNDLVIELVSIPLPTGAAMGMAGLGLLAIRRRSVR